MKRFLLACGLALSLAAVSQPPASAGCDFRIGGSFGLSFTTSGHCFHFGCCSGPAPSCGSCGGGYPGAAWGGYDGYSYGGTDAFAGYAGGYPSYGYGMAQGGDYAYPGWSNASGSQYQGLSAPAWGYQPVSNSYGSSMSFGR